ncbi:MAG: iscA [Gammaproteobacteria bacterium]|jgi:iron-sulfur cluster assembly protein|nr:iscA [Gammaproteobacteria bacterium]
MNPEVSVFEAKQQTITLTPAALEHLQKTITKRGKGIGIRLGVKKTGCSGFGYVIDIADAVTDDDQIFPIAQDLSVVVNRQSYPYLQGTTIDYVRKGLNSNFEFYNPNAKVTCGCGESFGTEEI